MNTSAAEVPVLIVGGGPAGLTASVLLSRHGIQTMLIDKHAAMSPLPRARGVHARAMEILRVCGVEPDMRRLELKISPGAEWRARLAGPAEREDVPGGPAASQVSPCEGLSVSQDVFESVLREHARGYDLAQVRAGVELESLDLAGGAVHAVVHERASGQRTRVRARYVIAADGARSAIRQWLGISMNGPGDLGSQRMIAFRADLSEWTGPRPRGIYFLTDSAAALIWTHPGHRWVLNEPGTAANGEPTDPVTAIRAALGVGDLPIEVLGSSRWTAAAQTAARYSSGPVFLAGDAAHRFPPAGATGIGTAIQDVHNLAWKLAAVLHGRAGTALLDSYAAEREAVGRRNAAETGAAWSRVWNPGGVPFAGRSLRQIDMGYQYQSAVITPDGSPDADQPGTDYTPTGTPGCRAPHLWIGTPRGLRSTIDLFDDTFVLLCAPPGYAWPPAARAVARRLGVPIHTYTIDGAAWPGFYGVSPTGAVLVRPDGHIAWRRRTAPGPGEPDAKTHLATAVASAACVHATGPAERPHEPARHPR
jgi:putative polyketide hydroxylase